MQAFGPDWSGGAQLFWGASQLGAQLRLSFPSPATGRYQVFLWFTRAPDFAFVRASFDGAPAVSFNGYAPAVSRDRVLLGMRDLTPGVHEVLLELVRRDRQSSGLNVGIDCIELEAVGGLGTTEPPAQPTVTKTAADERRTAGADDNKQKSLEDKTLEAQKAVIEAQKNMQPGGLALESASRLGAETRYRFTGTVNYHYGLAQVARYEVSVSARWDPATREADESISFQRINAEGGKVSASFMCSSDPFLAFPGEWATCQQTNLQIKLNGEQGAEHWQKMLEARPLTYRRGDPAAAHALMKDYKPNAPPPPPK